MLKIYDAFVISFAASAGCSKLLPFLCEYNTKDSIYDAPTVSHRWKGTQRGLFTYSKPNSFWQSWTTSNNPSCHAKTCIKRHYFWIPTSGMTIQKHVTIHIFDLSPYLLMYFAIVIYLLYCGLAITCFLCFLQTLKRKSITTDTDVPPRSSSDVVLESTTNVYFSFDKNQVQYCNFLIRYNDCLDVHIHIYSFVAF